MLIILLIFLSTPLVLISYRSMRNCSRSISKTNLTGTPYSRRDSVIISVISQRIHMMLTIMITIRTAMSISKQLNIGTIGTGDLNLA